MYSSIVATYVIVIESQHCHLVSSTAVWNSACVYSSWTEGERSVPRGAYGDSDAACITVSAAKSRYSMSETLSSGGKEGTDIGYSRVGAAVKTESCK